MRKHWRHNQTGQTSFCDRVDLMIQNGWQVYTTSYKNIDLGPVHRYPDIVESATFSFRIQKLSRPTRYRIRCGFIIFPSGERIKKYPDSPDARERKQYPERKSCGFKNIRIRVDWAFRSVWMSKLRCMWLT